MSTFYFCWCYIIILTILCQWIICILEKTKNFTIEIAMNIMTLFQSKENQSSHDIWNTSFWGPIFKEEAATIKVAYPIHIWFRVVIKQFKIWTLEENFKEQMQDSELKASLSLSLSQSNYMFWNPSAWILSWTKLS